MSEPARWTTAADLRDQLLRRWDRGEILAGRFQPEPLFPLRLSLRKPTPRELGERFPAVREWIRELEECASRDAAYEIEWTETKHRQLGRNRMPVAVRVVSEGAALAWIGKKREAARFAALVDATVDRDPALLPWIAKRPLALLEEADAWERILATVAWFRLHPRSGLYLRQLDVPGVDTKFIEARLGLFIELLDLALPSTALDLAATGARAFEARYGLRSKPALVRLRLLDPRLAVGGLSDVTAPVEEVAQLRLPFERVFIVENDVTGLAFPEVRGGVLIFGGGYSLDRLASIEWLRRAEVYYWGDLDTHGLALLGRLRGFLPTARSLLMDEATLLEHRSQWVQEQEHQRHLGPVKHLTVEESLVLGGLCSDRWGQRVRLEQERISFGRLRAALAQLE